VVKRAQKEGGECGRIKRAQHYPNSFLREKGLKAGSEARSIQSHLGSTIVWLGGIAGKLHPGDKSPETRTRRGKEKNRYRPPLPRATAREIPIRGSGAPTMDGIDGEIETRTRW